MVTIRTQITTCNREFEQCMHCETFKAPFQFYLAMIAAQDLRSLSKRVSAGVDQDSGLLF